MGFLKKRMVILPAVFTPEQLEFKSHLTQRALKTVESVLQQWGSRVRVYGGRAFMVHMHPLLCNPVNDWDVFVQSEDVTQFVNELQSQLQSHFPDRSWYQQARCHSQTFQLCSPGGGPNVPPLHNFVDITPVPNFTSGYDFIDRIAYITNHDLVTYFVQQSTLSTSQFRHLSDKGRVFRLLLSQPDPTILLAQLPTTIQQEFSHAFDHILGFGCLRTYASQQSDLFTQLKRDFNTLKSDHDILKRDHDILKEQNENKGITILQLEHELQKSELKFREGELKFQKRDQEFRECQLKFREWYREYEQKNQEGEQKLREGELKFREGEQKLRECEQKLRECEQELRVKEQCVDEWKAAVDIAVKMEQQKCNKLSIKLEQQRVLVISEQTKSNQYKLQMESVLQEKMQLERRLSVLMQSDMKSRQFEALVLMCASMMLVRRWRDSSRHSELRSQPVVENVLTRYSAMLHNRNSMSNVFVTLLNTQMSIHRSSAVLDVTPTMIEHLIQSILEQVNFNCNQISDLNR